MNILLIKLPIFKLIRKTIYLILSFSKQFFVVLLLFSLTGSTAFAQKCLDDFAAKQAKDIAKIIRKNPARYGGKKIAVIMFHQKTHASDTVKALLGLRLSEKIANYLHKEIKNTNCTILFPEDLSVLKMKQLSSLYFRLPDNDADAVLYREQYINNQKPDYYITGAYSINEQTLKMAVTNVCIYKDPLDVEKYKECVLPDNYFALKSMDINELRPLTFEIDYLNDAYYQLLLMKPTAQIFQFAVNDEVTKIPLKDNMLTIGNKYRIMLNSTQAACFYVFWFDQNEKPKPSFYVFEPLKSQTPVIKPAGQYQFPEYTYFMPQAPPGKVFIHIVATAQPLPITVFKNKLPQGGVNYMLTENHCKSFVDEINNLIKQNIKVDVKQMIYYVH